MSERYQTGHTFYKGKRDRPGSIAFVLAATAQHRLAQMELAGHRRTARGWERRDSQGKNAGERQEPSFYPYLSGHANLEVLSELDGPDARSRIDDVLEQLALTGRAADRVGGYSSGMRQRLGIAAALMRSPKLLLLDEPTSALDPAGARLVIGLLRTLPQDGVGVLLSSNKIEEVERVCDS